MPNQGKNAALAAAAQKRYDAENELIHIGALRAVKGGGL